MITNHASWQSNSSQINHSLKVWFRLNSHGGGHKSINTPCATVWVIINVGDCIYRRRFIRVHFFQPRFWLMKRTGPSSHARMSRLWCNSSEATISTNCVTSVVHILRRPLITLECESQLSIQSLSMSLTLLWRDAMPMLEASMLIDVGYCIKPELKYSERAGISLWYLFTPSNLSQSSIGIFSRGILLAMLVIYPS